MFMFIFEYITGYYWLIDWLIYVMAGLIWIYPAILVIKWLANKEAN